MIIDFHTHIFSPLVKEHREDFIRKDPLFAELYSNPKTKIATAEDLIQAMDDQGITSSVILNIGWGNDQLSSESNYYIMESISRYPDRLFGFGMINFNSPDSAIKEIDCCKKNGLRGVGEARFSHLQLKNLQTMQPIIEYLIENQLILLVHTSEPIGHLYPGKGDMTPDLVYAFISRFPGLKLVCAHWGGGLPFYSLIPEVNKSFTNVYFDSAASPYIYSPQIYSQVPSLAGDEHILFGTDFPLLLPERLLRDIKSMRLPEETQKRFLYQNAAALLGIQ